MSLTVCTVNFRTWKYIAFQDFTFRRLARDKGFKRLVCDVSPENEDAGKFDAFPNCEVFRHDVGGLKGSESHGAALNAVIPRITTEYGLIADPDTAALLPDWDEVCKQALKGANAAIGSPYDPEATTRYQNFPNAIFFFFRTKDVHDLRIDFRPEKSSLRNLRAKLAPLLPFLGKSDRDVGWQIPVKFAKKGLTASSFDFLKCHQAASRVLAPKASGDEFQWQGTPIITHQGRSGPRGFDQDPISKEWLDKVCAYLKMDRSAVEEALRGAAKAA